MILGPVSYLDCLVFCAFLAPQLIIHVGIIDTVLVVLQCLPFLCKSALEYIWVEKTLGHLYKKKM